MYFTWLDSNSWLIELAGQRILLDPWLVDTLTFNSWDWLFKGTRPNSLPIPENIDLILLSQGLEDHTHPSTLKQLGRNIPVVASPNAAKVARDLGYSQVTTLKHGETFILNQQLEIRAVLGALVGLNLWENGYVLQELSSGRKLYYEPHGNHSPQLQELAPIDVVITPVISLSLPLVGSIIKGMNSALLVAQWLKPQIMLPTAGAGEVVYEGLIAKFLRSQGSVAEFQLLLAQNNLATQVVAPSPGERVSF